MRASLAALLAVVAALAAAPRATGDDSAYESLLGIAATPADRASEEARLPEASRRAARQAGLSAGAGFDTPVAEPPPHRASRWTRLFALLTPPSFGGVPELKASTSAAAGFRPARRPLLGPASRGAEEGARRGLADIMALMTAGFVRP